MNTNTAIPHPPFSASPLRRLALLLPLFTLFTASAGAVDVVAPVPLFINYQGRVTDASGLPIGATGTAAAPVAGTTNRKVIFRIYDASTGGTRLWTEEQTVTISTGEFSVLLGNGIAPTGTASGESRPALDTVFNTLASTPGGARYLEVMVDEGGGTIDSSDVPISPRQQLTTTAYSFRAKSADSIASGTDLQLNSSANYGLGYYGSGRTFNATAVDGPVLYGLSGGMLGVVNGATQTPALRWNATGQIGIGSADLAGADATSKLVLQGDDATSPPKQLTIRGNTTTKRLYLGYNTTSNYGALQAYNGASTATNLALNEIGGNVGIGTNAPANKLTVSGNADFTGNVGIGNNAPDNLLAIGTNIASAGPLTGISVGAAANRHIAVGQSTTNNIFLKWTYNATAANAYGSLSTYGGSNSLVLQETAGNVGIGTNAPKQALDVNGQINVRGSHLVFDSAAGVIDWGPGNNLIFRSLSTQGNINTSTDRMWLDTSGNLNVTGGFKSSGSGGYSFTGSGDTDGGLFSPADGTLTFLTNNAERVRITSIGRVGIGTGAPLCPLDVRGGTDTTLQGNYTSIKSEWYVLAFGYATSSDLRIKQIVDRSSPISDLDTVMKLQVTNYHMKAQVMAGNPVQKGLIAQEVEKVIPEAVIKSVQYVPDIFEMAKLVVYDSDSKSLKITMDKPHQLAVGDMVKITSKDAETDESHEVKVTEVTDAKTFVVGDIDAEIKRVFVFGKQVNDFRAVDYNRVYTTGIGAIQQLKKEKDAEVKALKDENAELRTKLGDQDTKLAAQDKRLAEMDAKDKARDAKLAAIEKLLESVGKPAARTVSLKQSE